MPSQASAPTRALDSEIVSRLAKFFPDATPVRIPVRLSRAAHSTPGKSGNNHSGNNHHDPASSWVPLGETVIEFGTPQEILFQSRHALEFADLVLIESKDGSFRAEASVVAAQYHPERTVVAARFLKPVPHWIVKS